MTRQQPSPEAITATRLVDKVALLDRFPGMLDAEDFASEWRIAVDSRGPADEWLVEWDRLSLTVGNVLDLELARYAQLERNRARAELRRIVLATARELGLDGRKFSRPARRPGRPA